MCTNYHQILPGSNLHISSRPQTPSLTFLVKKKEKLLTLEIKKRKGTQLRRRSDGWQNKLTVARDGNHQPGKGVRERNSLLLAALLSPHSFLPLRFDSGLVLGSLKARPHSEPFATLTQPFAHKMFANRNTPPNAERRRHSPPHGTRPREIAQ